MRISLCIALAATIACNRTQTSSSGEGSRQRSASVSSQENDWRFYNGTLSGERYSQLEQITPQNVSQLQKVCTFDTNDTISFQSGLVVANGTLYATAFQNMRDRPGDNFGVKGRVYALDAATGKIVWQFNAIRDSGPANATWQKASTKNPPTGGATWTSYALDESTGILYVPTGNPAPYFVESMHPGDNLYAGSLVALDAKTGRLLDFIQLIKHDYHDWDVAASPALFDRLRILAHLWPPLQSGPFLSGTPGRNRVERPRLQP